MIYTNCNCGITPNSQKPDIIRMTGSKSGSLFCSILAITWSVLPLHQYQYQWDEIAIYMVPLTIYWMLAGPSTHHMTTRTYSSEGVSIELVPNRLAKDRDMQEQAQQQEEKVQQARLEEEHNQTNMSEPSIEMMEDKPIGWSQHPGSTQCLT